MADRNSRADWRRAAWVVTAAAAYLLALVAAGVVGAAAGAYARDVLGFLAPPPAFEFPPGAAFVWQAGVVWLGVCGPLFAVVVAANRAWPWWRAAAVPLVLGLTGAAGVLLATTGPDRFVESVIVAHLGLFSGLAGGALAWLRARVGRALDADAAVGDDGDGDDT